MSMILSELHQAKAYPKTTVMVVLKGGLLCTLLVYKKLCQACFLFMTIISGLVGFMGNGNLWGLIFTHKSEWGFMGIYNILRLSINAHKSP